MMTTISSSKSSRHVQNRIEVLQHLEKSHIFYLKRIQLKTKQEKLLRMPLRMLEDRELFYSSSPAYREEGPNTQFRPSCLPILSALYIPLVQRKLTLYQVSNPFSLIKAPISAWASSIAVFASFSPAIAASTSIPKISPTSAQYANLGL